MQITAQSGMSVIQPWRQMCLQPEKYVFIDFQVERAAGPEGYHCPRTLNEIQHVCCCFYINNY